MARSDASGPGGVGRREFLRLTAAGLAAAALPPDLGFAARRPQAKAQAGPAPESVRREILPGGCANSIPRRPFGRSGELVSILGLGGHHLGRIEDEGEAVELVRAAIGMGVTFLDNAWEYHGGRSEELVGKALKGGLRDRVFLMTKHHGRDKKTALRHLDDSLRRLDADVIDLWQFHEIIYDADPDMIFARDGGIEAAEEAKRRGKVRYVGFTGHKDPAIFKKMLARDYPWDAVQMPVNVLDAQFRSFQGEILPLLRERGVAPVAMKSMGEGHVLQVGQAGQTGLTPEECLRWAWSQPVATVVSGIASMDHLRFNVDAARSFKPLREEEKTALLERTAAAAAEGKFEPFKTTRQYDGKEGRKLHGVPPEA